jgi:hypothetical protein
LITEIGGAIGSAIGVFTQPEHFSERKTYFFCTLGCRWSLLAGALWTNIMPGKLEKHLPFLTEAKREELFGSITSVMTSPRGDPVREGVIQGAFRVCCLAGVTQFFFFWWRLSVRRCDEDPDDCRDCYFCCPTPTRVLHAGLVSWRLAECC